MGQMAGQMNRETTKAFISTVASCIFRFKRYPTTEELTDVARCIVEKYPFMKGKKKPYVSIYIYIYIYIYVFVVFNHFNHTCAGVTSN